MWICCCCCRRMWIYVFRGFLVFLGSLRGEHCCCLWNDLCRHSPATSASVEGRWMESERGRGSFIAGMGVSIFNSNNQHIHERFRTPRGLDLRSYCSGVSTFLRFPLRILGVDFLWIFMPPALLKTSFANGVGEIEKNALRISHSI